MSNTELKPCPICGGEVRLVCLNDNDETMVWCEEMGAVYQWFECCECAGEFLNGDCCYNAKAMAEWWNRRANE